MSDRFLMCKPQYFDVQYVINPWMQNNLGQVKPALAKEQWESFLQLLTQYAQIELIAPSPDLPDLVFCANAGLLYQNKVLLSNFRYPERQAEAKHFRSPNSLPRHQASDPRTSRNSSGSRRRR